MPFLLILAENTSFAGSINISDHNITDQVKCLMLKCDKINYNYILNTDFVIDGQNY